MTLLFCLISVATFAQFVTGEVVDLQTGEGIPYVNVVYTGKGVGRQSDDKGRFKIPYHADWKKLTLTSIGYKPVTVVIENPSKPLLVKMEVNARLIGEATVKGKREKYTRKDNPAVILMRKVIAAKELTDLSNRAYYRYKKYQKLNFAINDFTPKVLEEGRFKKMPFLKEHVERCPETGKLILPVSVEETLSQQIYRKDPKAEKNIILGQKATGLNEWFSTGDIMNVMLNECFTDVNIYDNTIRLLRSQFVSPLSSTQAIGFYRYFIADTLLVGTDRCIEVTFTPNNSQDFGFTGSLYILDDSTYRVRKVELGIPYRSAVNFVDDMRIKQEFEQLPTGEYVLSSDEMLVQLELLDFFTKFRVKRTTHYRDYDFAAIPEKEFNFLGDKKVETNAMMRDERYWVQQRPVALTSSEDSMGVFLKQMESVKGFNVILFIAKAFIENFVETSSDPHRPSKVDIGPVNTVMSQNFVEGFRMRASAQTTAHLNPNWFAKGYVAYGVKDHRWKGMGELTYAFDKKAYLPKEFPVHNLTFMYQNDVTSPSDKFLTTDKDNVFTSLKWTTVDFMNYVEKYQLTYEREWGNGLKLTTRLKRESEEPTARLFYQPLDGQLIPSADRSSYLKKIETTDAMIGLRYQPGVTYINTKQRRVATNKDAPIFELNHTVGWRGFLGGDYTYNYTEASIYKRFLLSSWGRINMNLKGGVQWNRVPFPLLITAPANLSYIKQEGTFSLIDNMEFLNDRFASLMLSWEPNGKIFNRIPLLRHLKWREYFGYNVFWGTLTDKNNPGLEQNQGDGRLFYFPGHFSHNGMFKPSSRVMNSDCPYMEWVVGVHNIFKILCVDYVRRVNYLDAPDVQKWGIRIRLDFSF